jgi:adenylate cyclase
MTEEGPESGEAPPQTGSSTAEPTTEASRRLFVSYSSRDTVIASAMVEALEREGVVCWIAPRAVKPGALYAEAIVRAIGESKALVLVLSESSVASAHVGKEVERASSKRRPLIALRIDDAPLSPALEYFLSESHWIDARVTGMDAALAKLIAAMREPEWLALGFGSFTKSGAPVSAAFAPPSKSRRNWILLAAGLAIFAVALVGVWRSDRAKSEQAAGLAAPRQTAVTPAVAVISEKSIAVMPFADMSEKHDQGYFADGLSEELVNVLGKLPQLRVIGHASSFRFRQDADDVRSIGTQLGAAHLVEGSVRRSGDHVRVTAQLIRSSDGVQEWSETYDRSVDDLLQVQTEIAMSLGRALQLSVADLQQERSANQVGAEAYDLYLRGLHANDQVSNEGFQQASGYLERAIDLEPRFVRAYEELATTHLLQAVFGAVPSESGFAAVQNDAQRLLKLDPSSGWGQTLLCRYHTEYSWNWPEAERQCADALALAPHFWLALFADADLALIRGDYAKSETIFREILPLDPLNADTYEELGLTLRAMGRFADAEAAFRRGLAITPMYVTAHLELGVVLLAEGRIEDAQQAFSLEAAEYGQQAGLAMAYQASGQHAKASAALEHFIQDHGSQQPMIVARAYSYLGEHDHAFDWLERAYRQKDPLMPYLKGDWLMMGLESAPRYKAFLQKMHLAD